MTTLKTTLTKTVATVPERRRRPQMAVGVGWTRRSGGSRQKTAAMAVTAIDRLNHHIRHPAQCTLVWHCIFGPSLHSQLREHSPLFAFLHRSRSCPHLLMQLVQNGGVGAAMRVVPSTSTLRPELRAGMEEGQALLARHPEIALAAFSKGAALTLNEQNKIVPLSQFQVPPGGLCGCAAGRDGPALTGRAGEGVKEGPVRFGPD